MGKLLERLLAGDNKAAEELSKNIGEEFNREISMFEGPTFSGTLLLDTDYPVTEQGLPFKDSFDIVSPVFPYDSYINTPDIPCIRRNPLPNKTYFRAEIKTSENGKYLAAIFQSLGRVDKVLVDLKTNHDEYAINTVKKMKWRLTNPQ